MKNILYNLLKSQSNQKRQVQMQRIREVIWNELTDLQRDAIIAYYFHRNTISEIAALRGVHKSTVSRTLRRAEEKLRRYLRY